MVIIPLSDYNVGDMIGDFVIKDVPTNEARKIQRVSECTVCGLEKVFRPDNIKDHPNIIFHNSHAYKRETQFPVGTVIGDMTIISHTRTTDPNGYHTRACMICKCNICGKERTLRPDSLGVTSFDHSVCSINQYGGLSVGEYHRFYTIWCNMKERCVNPLNRNYKIYGARGITTEYTDDQKGYLGFLEDMYQSYLEHVAQYGEKDTTLDRIDNSKGYYKDNLRWATRIEQAQNKRLMTRIFLAVDPLGNAYISNNQAQFSRNHPPLASTKIARCLSQSTPEFVYSHFNWHFYWMYSQDGMLFTYVPLVNPIVNLVYEMY